MISQRIGPALIDQHGKAVQHISTAWRSGQYEVWSLPFSAWIRDPGPAVTIRPGDSAQTHMVNFAAACNYPVAEVRMVIPDF